MFYCEPCAKKNGWPYPIWSIPSRGPCEVCGKTAVCVDVHHSALKQSSPNTSKAPHG